MTVFLPSNRPSLDHSFEKQVIILYVGIVVCDRRPRVSELLLRDGMKLVVGVVILRVILLLHGGKARSKLFSHACYSSCYLLSDCLGELFHHVHHVHILQTAVATPWRSDGLPLRHWCLESRAHWA